MMGDMRVAAVQAMPVWMDRDATVEKAVGLVQQSASEGARVVALSETFVPGYPWWVWLDDIRLANDRRTAARQALYLREAVDIARGDLDPIVAAAREVDAFVSIGVAELGPTRGSVYCSMVMISPADGVVGVHRKLKPTANERVTWADGDGHGLRVHEWNGWRVGGLNCWENWLPLSRYALYSQGEELHIMSWPGFSWQTLDPSRLDAIEGGMYVISSSGMFGEGAIPEDFPDREALLDGLRTSPTPTGDGGAVICGPSGKVLAQGEPGNEQIAYADIDLAATVMSRSGRDQGGHYHRPDVFDLSIDRSRRVPASFTE
jgi:nitrilase